MKRRDFILTGAAATIPAVHPNSASVTNTVDVARLARIFEQLEIYQGWEASSVVAAKSFAAWQFRKALSMPVGDSDLPQMHIDFQHESFERYQRTVWAERHLESGTVCQIVPMERKLV